MISRICIDIRKAEYTRNTLVSTTNLTGRNISSINFAEDEGMEAEGFTEGPTTEASGGA